MPEQIFLTVMTLAGFLICLFKVRQGFEYVADFKYAKARNMARF